jgi:nucleoid-associated protein YgaU
MGNFEKLSVLVIVVIIVMILVVAIVTWTDNPEAARDESTAAGGAAGTANALLDTQGTTRGQVNQGGAKTDEQDPWARFDTPSVDGPSAGSSSVGASSAGASPAGDASSSEPKAGSDASLPGDGSSSGGSGETVPPQPTPTPSNNDVPEANEPWIYTVKAGDTLSQIAERKLGTWRRQKEILALNAGLVPERLRVGDALKMPPRGRTSSTVEKPATTTGSHAAAPARSHGSIKVGDWYVTRRGDRLSRISKRAYGTIEYWPELWAHNLAVVADPDDLQAGTRIFIPKMTH